MRDLYALLEANRLRREASLAAPELQRLLLCDGNAAFDPRACAEVSDDMCHPLHEYFINSSHNTYVTGNQFNSASSADMYRRVITMGCNCVEIDVHDGEAGEPEV